MVKAPHFLIKFPYQIGFPDSASSIYGNQLCFFRVINLIQFFYNRLSSNNIHNLL